MTRRPVLFSGRRPALLALLAGTVLLSPAAHAARMTLSGEDLDLSIPCTGQVRVVVDPNMKDGATLDSSSLGQVAMHTGKEEAQSRISIATKSCAPNGKLTISISPSTGLTIHDSHDTHFVIAGKLASLDANLDSTTMDIENTQSLDLDMQGASSVHIHSLERAAQIVASGTSTLTADTAQLAALSVQLTQNAGMTLSGGTIDALTLITADQASATILAHATVATVAANGTGDVNIEAVTGPMVRSGKGTVRVGAENGVIYRPTPPPPATAPTPPPAVQQPSLPVQTPPASAAPTVPAPVVPPPPVSAPTVQTPVVQAPLTQAPATPSVVQAPVRAPQPSASESPAIPHAPSVPAPSKDAASNAQQTAQAPASLPIINTPVPSAPQTTLPASNPAPTVTNPAPGIPTATNPTTGNPATTAPSTTAKSAQNGAQGE
ncbi:hypothetical protein HKD21_02720 [Gluconobacter cerevisiae]|uniref:Auto-transporter adhesin head GIN domain-containing protein n=1 Tax=Gluconobacter cerevisiae TaxID=1379734 RepID=A0ABR9YAR9_9PROT|nr:hypothetical protein [Gluconobacter cerevisiae]MBF0875760.1 hypothetical protein [Gluconobacter cerevisiae]